MSENQSGLSATDAKVLRERAGDWLERRDRPDWTAKDQADLEAWLAESSANLVAYWRVEGAWERAQRLRAVHPPSSLPRVGSSKKGWSIFGRVAALVGVVAVAGFATTFFVTKTHEQVISTPVGGHKIIALGDGSRVELNTDTVLHLDITADHRLASIEKGEVYFQVAHDAKHPFVVAAGDSRITVLGTKFIVRQNSNHLVVALLDGRVWLDTNLGQRKSRGLLLVPGDEAVATAGSLTLTQKPAQDLQGELGWRKGMVIFRYVALADAAAELNRYNAQKLVVADAATARLKIIGNFPTNDIAMFVRASRQLFDLRVESRGDEIILSR
jgi:transmembrane sensor